MINHRNILQSMVKNGFAQEIGITVQNQRGKHHVIVNNFKDQRTDHYVANADDIKRWENN